MTIERITCAELVERYGDWKPVPEPGRKVTFDELVLAEPRLALLLIDAMKVKRPSGKPFCANMIWYGYGPYWERGLKQRMLPLVGHEREDRHPLLATPTAYDVAYDTIYEALPNCRDCDGCWTTTTPESTDGTSVEP